MNNQVDVSTVDTQAIEKKRRWQTAIYLGVMCAVAYFAVYIARNVLSAVTPKMLTDGFTEAFIGKASSVYFICYAVGQLLNGIIGDKIKARNMISLGLLLAGITNYAFVLVSEASRLGALIAYGATGFFLAMIYAPMTKVVAENTEPIHAVRCSLGYTFSSFLGSPAAGILAAGLVWQSVFLVSSIAMVVMAAVCFVFFLILEKNGRVKYNQFVSEKKEKESVKGAISLLIKRDIVRFTLVSLLTGVVRTSVVFWLPTYFKQHLGFSDETAALSFTVATFLISASAFLAVFFYELLHRNMHTTTFLMFAASAAFFLLSFFVLQPILNVIFITLAVLFSNCAASILWSVYCPSLWDTGKVSSATGFLDFASYMAAAVSSSLFATAATSIGWGALILVWFGLMAVGVVVCIPFKKKKEA